MVNEPMNSTSTDDGRQPHRASMSGGGGCNTRAPQELLAGVRCNRFSRLAKELAQNVARDDIMEVEHQRSTRLSEFQLKLEEPVFPVYQSRQALKADAVLERVPMPEEYSYSTTA
jgi:hypothetical protein